MGRHRWLAGLGSAVVLAVAASALVRSGDLAPVAAALAWGLSTVAIALLLWSTENEPARSATIPSQVAATHPSAATVIAALPGPAMLVAPDDTIAAFNVKARELLAGLRVDAPVSAATRHPDLLAAIRQARTLGSTQRVRYEERVPFERSIEAVVATAPAAQGGPAHLVVAFRDLTEEARVEQMRADFVANASHELRTPLASLQGFIETLQGPARNDPVARDRFLGVMAGQAIRMTRLIDDLMSLSKIEMREHVIPDGVADIHQIVTSTAQALEPLAKDANVKVEVVEPDDHALVRGDAQELEQVVQNLVQNAIKYGRRGGHVRIAVARRGGPTGKIAVSVADDGPGIAPEHLPRLTERFYRVDVPESRSRGGTGLGLAIVKHIINRHRGELLIESEVGKGTTFTALLPAIG
jgi:two-component system phosphate regulon sensor histidine kinase PhoR